MKAYSNSTFLLQKGCNNKYANIFLTEILLLLQYQYMLIGPCLESDIRNVLLQRSRVLENFNY
jgi:hypothetical protein